jgi:hypothetical protein
MCTDAVEYGLRYGERVIVGPDWQGPDQVIAAEHGQGRERMDLPLVCRADGDWRECGYGKPVYPGKQAG